MASKFRRGSLAYTQKGQSYLVDTSENGMVYCSTDDGAETEFPESALLTEAEWNARHDNKAGLIYQRLKQSHLYAPPREKLDPRAVAELLTKIQRLSPGILDFVAFDVAERILAEAGEQPLAAKLSVKKCREVFDAAKPEVRAGLLASLLGTAPDVLVGASRLGDNLMRAMIEKGMAAHEAEFESFSARRRD